MLSVQSHSIPNQGHKAIDMIHNYTRPRKLAPKAMIVHYVDGCGKNRICGGRDLKGSQKYPRGLLRQEKPRAFCIGMLFLGFG